MERKIILSADSTCDLGDELKSRYGVAFFPLHILLEGKQYTDGIDITPEVLYAAWREKRLLPKTAAVNPEEYYEYFKGWVSDGYQVIHITIGSGISSSFQNACIAASDLNGQIFPIDSQNLSTGIGLLVIEAAERIKNGMSALEIQKEITELARNSHASFIIDTLEFLHAGGRCSALAHLGANLLQIKPCIEVNNQNGGTMSVGKKYRGTLKKVLAQYATDLLTNRRDLKKDHVFITHSGIPQDNIDLVYDLVKELGGFKEIHVTRASSVISSHCGPNTLGVLFMTEDSIK